MRVHFTTRFLHEVDEQAEYLAQYSPARAKSFVDKVFRQLHLLQQHPQLGRAVPEYQDPQVRELLYRQYRLIYRLIAAERIDVLALRTGAQPLSASL